MSVMCIEDQVTAFLKEWESDNALISVHTSGSTGKPKELLVEKCRMVRSAECTCDFLGLKEGDSALLCLPLNYIAGKMMVVRSLVRGLKLKCVEPSGHPLADVKEAPCFVAMTPMQVFNSLENERERAVFESISHVIIGGGAVDSGVESCLRGFKNNVWSTYGMTETLSHIGMRKISGCDASSWYTCFTGVEVSLDVDNCLVVNAPELCPDVLVTNDIGVIDESDKRRFKILGRRDNVICSGGLKIHIEQVEDILRGFIRHDFIITKRRDSKFGEIAVLLTTSDNLVEIERVCMSALPKYQRPRLYATVKSIPLTSTGKIARKAAEDIAKTL